MPNGWRYTLKHSRLYSFPHLAKGCPGLERGSCSLVGGLQRETMESHSHESPDPSLGKGLLRLRHSLFLLLSSPISCRVWAQEERREGSPAYEDISSTSKESKALQKVIHLYHLNSSHPMPGFHCPANSPKGTKRKV